MTTSRAIPTALLIALCPITLCLVRQAAADAAPPSIQARIDAAAPGDVVRIGSGVHREHIRIDRPLRLIGVDDGGGMPVIDGGGSGDIVEIAAPDVTFSGFVVRGTGIDLDRENCAIRVLAPRATIEDNQLEDVLFGIDLKGSPDSVVRSNRIGGKDLDIARRGDGLRLWRSDRARVEDNQIHDGRDAILWYSTGVTVRGNRASRCRYGLHLMYSDEVTIEDNELTDNSVGIYLMYSRDLDIRRNRLIGNRGPSGYGIGLKEADRYVIEDNLVAGNRAGAYLDGSPFSRGFAGTFRGNLFALNDVGVTFLPAVRGNRFAENSFIDNQEQIAIAGRGELQGNEFAIDDRGNYWSDYVGYDLDRDGVGDWEHAPERLFESLLDRTPSLRLFSMGPAQQAVEFVARAVPAIRPEAKFFDPAPLMARADAIVEAPAPGAARGLTLLAIACAVVAGTLILTTRTGLGLARCSGALP